MLHLKTCNKEEKKKNLKRKLKVDSSSESESERSEVSSYEDLNNEEKEEILLDYKEVKKGDWYVPRSNKFDRSVFLAIAFIAKRCIIAKGPITSKEWQCSTSDYAKRVILTPTNVASLTIIKEVLERLHGQVKTYLSAGQIETNDLTEINNFPVEFLNSLTLSCMPIHCLTLKVDCVIILLRNLDLKAGLCNGIQMKACALQNNYIDAEVLTGVSEGKQVFVTRIQLAPLDSNLSFVLKHRQFPVRLAYSMTINKYQGQTFDRVGVYLKQPCFSHGRLFVACLRTRAFNSLFFKVDKHPI
nr:uncharacterized protein LOC124817066 [Hydra vulgaris]